MIVTASGCTTLRCHADQKCHRPERDYDPAEPADWLRPYGFEPVKSKVQHRKRLNKVVDSDDDEDRPEYGGRDHRQAALEVQVEQRRQETGTEDRADRYPLGRWMDEELGNDETGDGEQKAEVEAGHEEADVLDEHRDEATEYAGADGDADLALNRQQVLLKADEVRDE